MKYIVDKIIILFLSLITFGRIRSAENILIALLIVVIYASINSYFESKKICIISNVVFSVLMPIVPSLICFIPMVVAEVMLSNTWYMLIVVIISAVNSIVQFEINSIRVIKLVLICGVALYLIYNSVKRTKSEGLVNKIRDDSYEKRLLLEKNNKILSEKQNYEIYAATLKERNRIAREIHDNVGHVITRSILQMGALMVVNKQEPLHSQLEMVKNNLDIAMNTIRESVHDLHDESIDMQQVISDIVAELKTKYDVKYEYDVSKSTDKKYKYAIIGIVKEASSNIMKHSNNTNVNVVVREHPSMYQVIVHDYSNNAKTNVGENDVVNSDGIGLSNIKDRVEGLNGILRIDKNNGFKVFVTIPKQSTKR